MSATKRDVLGRLGPALGVPDDDRPLDERLTEAFGRRATRLLDVGIGNGEATVAEAAAHPTRDVLAVELHRPSLAAALTAVEASGLTNVRILEADARDVLDEAAPGDVDAVRLLFPDPWPKRRHHGRRLVDAAFVARVAEVLPGGGTFHLATDWRGYAEQVVGALLGDGRFVVDPSAPRPPRPTTAYERIGLAAGRSVTEVVATRRH